MNREYEMATIVVDTSMVFARPGENCAKFPLILDKEFEERDTLSYSDHGQSVVVRNVKKLSEGVFQHDVLLYTNDARDYLSNVNYLMLGMEWYKV